MANELELCDFTTIHELQGTEARRDGTKQSGMTPRRLLRVVILTLGVLCMIQATLNISLRLAFYSKEDADQFPFNVSVITDVCQIDQCQQNSTLSCTCCKKLLRSLLREFQTLKTERDNLRRKLQTAEDDSFQESGSGVG